MKVLIGVAGRFHAYELAKQLDKNGLDYRLVTSYYKTLGLDPGKVKLHPFLTYIPYALKKVGLNRILDANRIKTKLLKKHIMKECKKYRPDILHIFAGYSPPPSECSGLRVVDHGTPHTNFREKVLGKEYSRLGLKYHPIKPSQFKRQQEENENADLIFVPSTLVSRTFEESGIKKDKLAVVPYGVDSKRFRPVKKKDAVFRIVFVGNLSVQKGIHYLLEAVSRLKIRNMELLLMGGIFDDAKPFLKKYKGCYKYIGKVPNNELYKYYGNSSVFVLPSVSDGFGMVVLEAMACGVPVIVSENVGAKDVVEDGKTGFVVPAGNADILKEKISYLHRNPKKAKQMGKSARRKAKKLTWDEYGKNIIKHYRKALEGKK